MAQNDVVEALSKALTGLGVDEKALVQNLAKATSEHRCIFRKSNPRMFEDDEERGFQIWNEDYVDLMRHEFLRFKNAVVLCAMHPWERDARIIKESLKEGESEYSVIVEVACTRSPDELVGARKAYHALFDLSVEEDVAVHVRHPSHRKLLLALVCSYRYQGTRVNHHAADSEAQLLAAAIGADPIDNDDVVRILSTRSKPHLREVCDRYRHISGKRIEEDLNDRDDGDSLLKSAIECLSQPPAYFSRVLIEATRPEADPRKKSALTRVVVTRAEADMNEIGEEYSKMHGCSLEEKVEEAASGSYKDFLLALLGSPASPIAV